MLGNVVVVDSVVHPYDLGPGNQIADGLDQANAVYRFHIQCTGGSNAEYVLSRDEFFSDFDHDALTHAIFAESPVDLAIIHSLPNLGFTKGKLTDPDRMAELRNRYPNRYLLYATVDTPITDVAIRDLERQVEELNVEGLKLYPAFFYDGTSQGWRLDGPDFATPLLEAARDLGLRNVAIHKALPVPPAPDGCFAVDDIGGALTRFPSLNFHIVHAGAAFLTETAALLSQHDNVFANLESSFSYVLTRPLVFAEMLGALLAAGGPDRLLYGSGANLTHPRLLTEAFANFEMPRDLIEEHGYSEITDEIRGKILGGNALRTHNLTVAEVEDRIHGDQFATRNEQGQGRPWGALRGDVVRRK